MSYYTDRWLKFAPETTWGNYTMTGATFPNYLTEWAGTTTENKAEEDIIAGSRDYRKRVWLEEGVVGRWVQEVVSAKIFEYCLGTRTGTAGTVSPSASTYSPASTVPSMSIYRGLYPDENGNTVSIGYYGMKVDTWELTIEQGGDVKLELNFAGKGCTISPTAQAKPSPDMTAEAFSFYHSSIDINTAAGLINIEDVQRIVISGNNNLEARYSAGAGSYRAVEIREGALEITGRLTVGSNLAEISTIAAGRQETTVTVYLKKTGSTITFTLRNVTFDELPDELTGLEPVELELPFTARASTTADAITVTETATSAFNSLLY